MVKELPWFEMIGSDHEEARARSVEYFWRSLLSEQPDLQYYYPCLSSLLLICYQYR